MNELKRRRLLQELGQRAVDYYVDTGLCVFCDADDVARIPHDECVVGEASGVQQTTERAEEKSKQRLAVARYFGVSPGSTDDDGQARRPRR